MRTILLILALTSFVSVSILPAHDDGTEHNHDHSHEAHHHSAPNGGTLVEIGDHSGNLEFKFNSKKGLLKVWLLDGCAENYVRSDQKDFSIQLISRHLDGDFEEPMLTLKMKAKANLLTGETVGNTALFQVKDKRLKNAKRIKGMIPELIYKGAKFKQLYFDLE